MVLNLNALATPKEIVVPILNNSFQYNHKKYALESPDGWWVVVVEGNKAKAKEPYFWVSYDDKKYKWLSGYTYNNQIIFYNFDIARRLFGMTLTAPLLFNTADTFSSIKSILWETGQIFYTGINYSDTKIYEIKATYDQDTPLGSSKGVTPELQTLYLFHSLEKEQQKEMLRQIELAQENERRMKEIPYRLGVTLERAGAKLVGYSQSGNRLIIEWELKNGNYKYNSVIDSTTWMVIEAGYCLSGGDKKLNVTSLAKTAEEYEERDVIFITRH
jgi:hypothetical protein